MRENDFEISQTANMDEVPFIFDVPSNKVIESKGTWSVTAKQVAMERHITKLD